MRTETVVRPLRLAGRRRGRGLLGKLRLDDLLGVGLWQRIVAGIILAGFGFFAVGLGVGALAFAVCVGGPRVVRDVRASRRRRLLESQLSRAAELLARQLASGASLRQALRSIPPSLPEPIGSELRRVNTAVSVGSPPARAFRGVADEIGGDVFGLAAHALQLHAHSGGDVAGTLRRLAKIARGRRVSELEIASMTAQGRLSGVIVGLSPIVMSVFVHPGDSGLSLWAELAIELTGWLLVGLGLWMIWKLTSPGRPGLSRPAPRFGAASRALVWVGERVPGRIAGRERTRRLWSQSQPGEPSATLGSVCAAQRLILCCAGLATLRVWGVSLVGVVTATGLGVALWFVPEIVIRRRGRAESSAIDSAVPYLCDVLSLAFGSGKNLHQALADAATTIGAPLGAHIQAARGALELGATLDDALEMLAERSRSDDVDEVVATLLAARRRGGQLGPTLDDLGRDMRQRDRLRRQAAARKLPIKIIFPLVFCVLPAFVLLGIVPLIAAALADLDF